VQSKISAILFWCKALEKT